MNENPTNLLTINEDSDFPVNGRELHERLGISTQYKDWFPRMCEYGFTEGEDFNSLKNERVQIEGTREVSRTVTDHCLTLSMAKELCMIQRTEAGKQVRRYLIEVENAWNSPDQLMARALRVAEQTISKLHHTVHHLEAANSELTVEKQVMQPKADYFDELVDRNLLTNFRETAKQLGVKEKKFVDFLLSHKYIYRDKRGRLMPYADRDDGLFELKECCNTKTNWSGTQTLITPKGRETFRLLTQGM